MIKVRQVKVNVEKNSEEEIKRQLLKKLKAKSEEVLNIKITKQSIDAREKPILYFVYELEVQLKNEQAYLNKNKSKDIFKEEKENFQLKETKEKKRKLNHRPIVVGSGPAGLFCAYILAYYGYNPIILERGKDIEERVKDVEFFFKENKLNVNSNIQFGLGGAGTFSDGKLNTLVKDKRHIGKKVFEIFVECGAPSEILYAYKPHIGTDLLRVVIKNMKQKIISMGGSFFFEKTVTNLFFSNDKIEKIEINHQETMPCEALVLAIGHSARDTFFMLNDRKLEMKSKPFAVGIRISHPQKMINKSQYGTEENKILGPASYKLTYNTKEKRGVYSFCMCPGGYVVNASSEKGRLAINGMSNHQRESENANSALLVTVSKEDYGEGLFDGVLFQRKLEEQAYKLGQGLIPIQLYKDFKANKKTTFLEEVKPLFKGSYTLSNLRKILPEWMSESLIEAIEYFNHKIKGYSREDAILAAIESRSSSPIRIIRNEEYESNKKGVYPCGEGAGYAGGITTSAMDGIKVAEQIINTYKKEK